MFYIGSKKDWRWKTVIHRLSEQCLNVNYYNKVIFGWLDVWFATWLSTQKSYFQPYKMSCRGGVQGIIFTRMTSLSGILFLPWLSPVKQHVSLRSWGWREIRHWSAVSHRLYRCFESFCAELLLFLSFWSFSPFETLLKLAPLSLPGQVQKQLQCLLTDNKVGQNMKAKLLTEAREQW